MKFLIDESLGATLARALQELEKDVVHVTKVLPMGSDDEVVFQFAGTKEYFLVHRDDRMRYKPNERLAIARFNVGMFFLVGKNKSSWEITKQVIWHWEAIEEEAAKSRRPFLKQVRFRGEKILDYPLT